MPSRARLAAASARAYCAHRKCFRPRRHSSRPPLLPKYHLWRYHLSSRRNVSRRLWIQRLSMIACLWWRIGRAGDQHSKTSSLGPLPGAT